ncbi:thiolase family protein [Lysinibacillus yapensis]|uniref:acetyl-CoA C-acetyltransferase n=1 Tax=Ureibacillus yapensis TaxID=2304605 RepID=A0A396SI56_9BACL|nr:thiolase family protein [Lysinibacillus yapensis]RHW38405.1 thiolase family protein [Lysinibacillus yapensis]
MREEVYIVEGVRTAIGKIGGALKDIMADQLAEHVITGLLGRTEESVEVDEVILGQSRQSGDAANIARVASLRAKLPVEVTAYTVHRQCGSGLQAINNAAQQIALGINDVIIAGGTESMSNAPFYLRNARYGLGVGNNTLYDSNTESQVNSQPVDQYGVLTMGYTAENLAEKYKISREAQDEFALRSQELASKAISEGYFNQEILPYEIKTRKAAVQIATDEHPRSTSLELLAKLKPVFKEGGTVTAGNSSGRNDGASALLLMSGEKLQQYGLTPKVKIIAQAVSGVSPEIMGIGPVKSTEKALKVAGLSLNEIDLIELNEAFAAQSLAVIQELNLDLEKVNVNGGAIALGHPIGATGAILMTKLMNELIRRNGKYGLVTLCIGGGQGITTIVENCRYVS